MQETFRKVGVKIAKGWGNRRQGAEPQGQKAKISDSMRERLRAIRKWVAGLDRLGRHFQAVMQGFS